MLTRSEANNLVEALNEAGFSCSLSASPTPTDGREYELAVTFGRLDLDGLSSLFKVMERLPDARLLVHGGHITIS